MSSKRPKGYMPDWQPQEQTQRLIDQVESVLATYRQYLPMTARQIFYRLVGQFNYDKTEQAYARLCETLVKARRAEMISFGDIRDDGTFEQAGGGYADVAMWWQGELGAARGYRRDRMEGQKCRIEVWCEAAGMAPQLARVVAPYGVGMYSTGGFSSVTVTHEIAERAAQAEDLETVFMHLGDYDPSGESIFNSMSEDVEAFFGAKTRWLGDFRAERIALTASQVTAYNLPTAPPKRTDSRSRRWVGDTCQLEAMDPQALSALLVSAIEDELDLDLRQQIMLTEAAEREALVADVTAKIEGR